MNAVYVDTVNTFMTHDKFIIVDNSMVMEGSVNMTGRALMSSGMMIIDDMRTVQPLIDDFVQVLNTARSVSRDEVAHFIDCTQCAE